MHEIYLLCICIRKYLETQRTFNHTVVLFCLLFHYFFVIDALTLKKYSQGFILQFSLILNWKLFIFQFWYFFYWNLATNGFFILFSNYLLKFKYYMTQTLKTNQFWYYFFLSINWCLLFLCYFKNIFNVLLYYYWTLLLI